MKEQSNQSGFWRFFVAVGGVVGIVTICGLVVAFLQLGQATNSQKQENSAQATAFAHQVSQLNYHATQIANQGIQISLGLENNRLASERATNEAQRASIEESRPAPVSTNDTNFALTATAFAALSNLIEATRQAIEARQRQIEATQTSVARTQATPIATITLSPISIAIPEPAQIELYDLTIPSYQEAGVRFDAPRNGTYKILFLGGAYSPYASDNGNDNKWRTILRIYKNRDIEWGERFTLIEPINSDFQLGDFETGNPSEAEAEARAKGTYINLSLNMGDYLIIVAVDEKGSYLFEGKNRGDLYLQVTLPSK